MCKTEFEKHLPFKVKWGNVKKGYFSWDFGKCLIQLKEETYSSVILSGYKMEASSKYKFTK